MNPVAGHLPNKNDSNSPDKDVIYMSAIERMPTASHIAQAIIFAHLLSYYRCF